MKTKYFICGSNAKHFILLGKTITDIVSLAESNQIIFCCLGNKKHFLFLGKARNIFSFA